MFRPHVLRCWSDRYVLYQLLKLLHIFSEGWPPAQNEICLRFFARVSEPRLPNLPWFSTRQTRYSPRCHGKSLNEQGWAPSLPLGIEYMYVRTQGGIQKKSDGWQWQAVKVNFLVCDNLQAIIVYTADFLPLIIDFMFELVIFGTCIC